MSFANLPNSSISKTRNADTKREIGEILGKFNIIKKQLDANNMPEYLKIMFNKTCVPYEKNLVIDQNKILSGTEITDLNSVVANLNKALEQMTENIKIYQTADDYGRMGLMIKHSQNQVGGNRKIKKSKSKSLRNKRSKKTRKH